MNYQKKVEVLRIDEKGVKIISPEGPMQIVWRNITDVIFRNVVTEDSVDIEWLQLTTTSNGQVSVRLNFLDVSGPDEIEEKLIQWRAWAHQERMRIAMGGKK